VACLLYQIDVDAISPRHKMGESVKEDRLSAARGKAAADAKAKADAIAQKKAESAAAAKLQAERKAYAAREATEKAERGARALVVDTDIGWNPDDVIAVWALCMHTLRSRTRVLIISSDEIYPQNPRHQLIQRVINAVSEDVNDLGWDRVSNQHFLSCSIALNAYFRTTP
jgi:hypothetical protein